MRSAAVDALEQAHTTRYRSYLLADEARQNSADLSSFARTFVATGGDKIYEDRYNEVIARSDGSHARAVDPHRLYWELVLRDDKRPRPDGQKKSLLDEMREEGFTAEELGKLQESKKASDALVALETKAMNAVKGFFDDGSGGYTLKKEPDTTMALGLLYSDQYQGYIAGINRPVEEFYGMIEGRTARQVEDARSQAATAGLWMQGSLGVLLFSLLTSGVVLLRRVVAPIKSLQAAMLALAGGDKKSDIPHASRHDEIGDMARAVCIFKDAMIETERLRAEQEASEERVEAARKAEMRRLADEFQNSVGGIVDAVSSASTQLETAAGSLTRTAETTQELSGVVATASEQTSVNVQGVAAASEQLSATVSEIGRQVQQSSTIADKAVQQASNTNERVAQLSQSADRIGDVIGLINTIAGQTNLLALNATIEAARAGDAGKGFAVVAQEVKALAAQTGKATSDIAAQIAGMQQATQEAVGAIEEITSTINRMSEICGAIAAAVEEQGVTTQEISRNVLEAAKGTSEVAASITDVSKGASETGTASSQVLSSAQQLSSDSTRLRREVERFLSTVRAA
ncbi:methyl-accepting chemotaxis protein [Hyphomicrobium sp.]|uniref:methyl-accepting chemotaxis protein n=1 Tax=Hyphomicrobium sp. TaxID=82 RepID=UPI002E35EE4E|nr:methyl-accepting chemotaxis protein [Hyphomicrobium sp.]HEX2840381.1 methyl-accepting chemotaxis protein [Hyphomicrobium sp.]